VTQLPAPAGRARPGAHAGARREDRLGDSGPGPRDRAGAEGGRGPGSVASRDDRRHLPNRRGVPQLSSHRARDQHRRHDGQRFRVDCAEIRSLVTIAVWTGQSQVRGLIAASMLPCPDMLHVESKRGSWCLGKPTVFATIAGPVPNKLTHGRIHVTTLPDYGGLHVPESAGS